MLLHQFIAQQSMGVGWEAVTSVLALKHRGLSPSFIRAKTRVVSQRGGSWSWVMSLLLLRSQPGFWKTGLNPGSAAIISFYFLPLP